MHGEAPRRLAVCADDYGLHPAIDEAVLALAQRGRISATSCMTGSPNWRSAAPALRGAAATLEAGLHLDLTEHPFQPRLRMPLQRWAACAHGRLVPRTALRAEVDAQLDAFEAAVGRPPAHVDGHQHVHQLPGVRDIVVAALEARYPASRPWLRRTRRLPGLPAARKSWLIQALGDAGLHRLASGRGYRQNEHLLGVYDFEGDTGRYLALLDRWLRAARDGDLLVCHPATRTPAGDAIGPARRREYEVLAGPAFGDLVAREGLRIGW